MKVTFVYAYYRNPAMFRRQMQEWAAYPDEIRNEIEFIITDDCSPKAPITQCLADIPDGLNIRLFRITKKAAWNWLACRNIGAHHAKGQWVMLTDMDHMMSKENVQRLFNLIPQLYKNMVYLFTRQSAPDLSEYKPHDDSYFMKRDMFWSIGGYDEELAGNYGTAGRFRTRAIAKAKKLKRLNIPLIRFPREVIKDASTTDLTRKLPNQEHQKRIERIEAKKAKQNRAHEVRVLSFPYEEIEIK